MAPSLEPGEPRDKKICPGHFVIQCKFTSRANYNLTESDLSDEFDKARKLVDKGICDSYVLMTNAGLSGDLETKIDHRLKVGWGRSMSEFTRFETG